VSDTLRAEAATWAEVEDLAARVRQEGTPTPWYDEALEAWRTGGQLWLAREATGPGSPWALAVWADFPGGDLAYVRGLWYSSQGQEAARRLLKALGQYAQKLGRRTLLFLAPSGSPPARLAQDAGARSLGTWPSPGAPQQAYAWALADPQAPAPPVAAPTPAPWSTEAVHPGTRTIDRVSPLEAALILHREDHRAVEAVDAVLPQVAAVATQLAQRYRQGGRWLFVGAGTSGRLAAAEAAECPPTFGTPPDRVVAVLAGGPEAFLRAREGAEDDAQAAEEDLRSHGVGPQDAVVGLSASGRAPYVVAALRYARSQGSYTVAVACTPASPLEEVAEAAVVVDTGPEAILGSTRLKAGTAQKLVLNMLTTLAMIQLGRVYENLMVHLTVSNQKLWGRAVRLTSLAAQVPLDVAEEALTRAKGSVALAVVMLRCRVDEDRARRLLDEAGGDLRRILP
jgi:N-acetylmuramic acid 6-phosphate etherase